MIFYMVAYGVGVDSTAMLIQMKRLSIMPKFILFADTGAEKQKTYEYLPVIQDWLKSVKFPPVTIVKYVPKKVPYRTIEENMVQNATLPAPVFGRNHNCSMKWKFAPQQKWTMQNEECLAWIRAGKRITKLIGFEYGEERRVTKAKKAHAGDEKHYKYWYPLAETWSWTRERCMEEIDKEGLPVPVKSSCYFCPAIKEHEIRNDLTPDERGKIIRIEVTAEPYNKKVQGLWRRPRKNPPRPASITEFILENNLEYTDPARFRELPLSPRCNKRLRGYAINPPHIYERLRKITGYEPCTCSWEEETTHEQIALSL